MEGLMMGLLSALWLGILTSISPCPLATNIAAASFIGRKIGNKKDILLSGLLYTLGRTLAYILLGMVIIAGVTSTYIISNFLQNYMHKILGPVLILVGMLLLNLIVIDIGGAQMNEDMQKKVEKGGIWGALFLGVFFALSFCPVSAALFFGSLIPLSIKYGSNVIMPLLYGIGTGIPVLIFALLMAFSAEKVGKLFNKVTSFEKWARYITGGIFIAVGIFYCLRYIFGVV
jgi:cytochrome c biogenesis protein CcdA